MLAGFYTAASGLLVQQRNISVIGNNITNAETPGYRTERAVMSTFDQEYLVRVHDNGIKTYVGTGSPVSLVDDIPVNYDGSSLKETENPFDHAIVGEGYFNIQGAEREYMTRNGNFNVDTEGYLVLEGVGRVIGQDGFINVGGSDFTVDTHGVVYDADHNQLGTLKITMPENEPDLVKYNNALFICTGNTRNAENYSVYQFCQERSNLDVNQEYMRLIEAQSAFKACSTAMGIVDTMNAKATQLASIT